MVEVLYAVADLSVLMRKFVAAFDDGVVRSRSVASAFGSDRVTIVLTWLGLDLAGSASPSTKLS